MYMNLTALYRRCFLIIFLQYICFIILPLACIQLLPIPRSPAKLRHNENSIITEKYQPLMYLSTSPWSKCGLNFHLPWSKKLKYVLLPLENMRTPHPHLVHISPSPSGCLQPLIPLPLLNSQNGQHCCLYCLLTNGRCWTGYRVMENKREHISSKNYFQFVSEWHLLFSTRKSTWIINCDKTEKRYRWLCVSDPGPTQSH